MPLIVKESSMIVTEASVIVDGWAIDFTKALLEIDVGNVRCCEVIVNSAIDLLSSQNGVFEDEDRIFII